MIQYTLEEHLKLLSEQDKDYEVLNFIWELNKKNLSLGLKLIYSSFPHYSAHDLSHSMEVINNIQCFLGKERIERLGPTDTFLLLMGALTHDIGMILTHQVIEKEWGNENFVNVLNHLTKHVDSDIAKAASHILNIKSQASKRESGNFAWLLEVKNDVMLITAEIFRNKHARLSAEYLMDNEEFKKLAGNFYSTQIPGRYIDVLAEIAYLHNEDFDQIISRLHTKANGYKGDYIHPRFLACMIRLGDLLDFDRGRFNPYSVASLKKLPATSLVHRQKHDSVKHRLVCPLAIEMELDCPDENVYREAMKWADWLYKEINDQCREWKDIAPEGLGGLPPSIDRDSIRVFLDGFEADRDLLYLRFAMSQKKIFDILRGGGIYKDPGLVFIREIVQNAIDASKIQLWHDIQTGCYDSYLGEGEKRKKIEFPEDIDEDIYKHYPIKLKLSWEDAEQTLLRIECSDRGTGISKADLLRMTKYVGETHLADDGYKKNYDGMPYWLRPTAAFGVGLQSVFFAAQTFTVETATSKEAPKRIIFRSAADGLYCSVRTDGGAFMPRGTKVVVNIRKEQLRNLFGNSVNWEILQELEVFKEGGDDHNLARIDYYVRYMFAEIENMHFFYETIDSNRNFSSREEQKNQRSVPFKKTEDDDIRCSCFTDDDGYLVFAIREKVYGSSFRIWFNRSMDDRRLPQSIMLRDIYVTRIPWVFKKLMYLGFVWNLNNQMSDKIVDISRSRLTPEGNNWVIETLSGPLLRRIIRVMDACFRKKIAEGKAKNPTINCQYFNFCLAKLAITGDSGHASLNMRLSPQYATRGKKSISVSALLKKTDLYSVSHFQYHSFGLIDAELQDRIRADNKISDKVVIWHNGYLHPALNEQFICSRVIKYDKDYRICQLEKKGDKMEPAPVVCDDMNYLLALEDEPSHRCSRATIYGLKDYSDIIVQPRQFSGFESFPLYSTCCIFTPFKSKDEVKSLMSEVKDVSDAEVDRIIRSRLPQYITGTLMDVILSYNVNKNMSKERVYETYSRLIRDFISVKRHAVSSAIS